MITTDPTRVATPEASLTEVVPYSGVEYYERLVQRIPLTNDGDRVAGSHNFDAISARMGTAEMALLRHEPIFAATLGDFVLRFVE